MISDEEVRQIAALARLELEDEEVARLGRELGQILNYISGIMAALDDTDEVWQTAANGRLLEADEVAPSLPWQAALDAAPAVEGEGFAVPFPGDAT